jgi:glycosyltransferase involved in cell wall biosynthesis
LRIAYVITRADEVGGAHIHLRDLADWMRLKGHEVHIFVGGKGPFSTMIQAMNIPLTSLNHLKRPINILHDCLAINELARLLGDYQPDLVSLHSAKAGLLGRLACKRAQFPVIFTVHGWSFAEGVAQPARSIYRWLERWAACYADRIITVCNTDRCYALQQRIGKPEQIVAINNGMPAIPENLVADPVNSVARIVMVARFEKQKDHATLIKALGGLKDREWELELVGNGPLLEDMRALVAQRELGGRVNFLGRRDDIPEILSVSDIFVLASCWEGFPRSIIEAMRAALPVVASAVAGVPEAVTDAETGYLVESGNVEQIRHRLRLLIEDRALRKRLGSNGRIRYEQLFTFNRMAGRTLDVYASVLSSSS